ncbi:unnamed protein product, partial [Phaeothamnion confervicola]
MRSGRVTAAARLQPASLVLIDRTLDLATPATRGGSLLQRMLAVLPRAGAKPNAEAGTAVAGTGRLRDMPSAQKALASFPWPGPPSICHPNDPAAAAAVAAL